MNLGSTHYSKAKMLPAIQIKSDFSRELLIKSETNRLSVKIFWFKAWSARNSRAIAKFHNAETGHFNHKMSIHDLIRGSLAAKV